MRLRGEHGEKSPECERCEENHLTDEMQETESLHISKHVQFGDADPVPSQPDDTLTDDSPVPVKNSQLKVKSFHES